MKKCGLFVTCFLMAAMSLTVFNSCDIDIGLGAAIDTEVPSITIENPPTDSIICDAFVISGNYSDDGEISSISLDLKNTENKKSYSFPGKFDDDSNWSAEINPLDEKTRIPDGKYEVKITISDKGGHKSNTTRSFVIDNTAPVLVLSRPSSKDDEKDANKIESYGQNLTLKGQVSDTNNVERLVIDFYSEDNPDKSLYTETIQNISPDIALDVAHFLDGKAYNELFGTEIEGPKYLANIEKKFYCTVSVYDFAKRYPAENGKENLGNKESEYILMSDWQKFQNDYLQKNGSSLQLPDLYSIKTTRTKDGSNRSAAEDGKDDFGSLFSGAIAKGSFKLNPKNNPTFLISTLSLEEASDVESEQPLTVQLFQGLDGIELKDADKMAVYLIPLDDNGNKIEGVKIYPQNQEYKNTGNDQINIKIIKNDCKDKSPKSEDINKASYKTLEYGTTYILGVDGQDIKGNEILPSLDGKEYRINFRAKKQAPELKIDNPSLGTSYIAKGKSVTISGTTSLPDGKPTISITCKIDDGDTEDIEPVELELDRIEDNQIVYKFSKTLTTEFFNQEKSHQYTFEITSDMDGWKTSISKTVIYDVDGPTISIDSMLPTAEKYTGDEKGSKEEGIYLNGKVTMKIAILDDYDSVNTEENKKPYYIITDENNNEIEKNFISTPTKQSFTINTEDLPSGKIKVKIYAEDRAGNLGVDIDDPENTSFERIYIVDQSTDAPVILPYNYESVTLTHSTKDSIESAITKNDFRSVLTTGSSIQFKLIDDDGIKYVTFKIGEKDIDEDLENIAGKTETQNNQKEIIYSYQVPTSIGRYKCAITVEDINGKSTTKTFWIVTTGAAPQVSISRTEPNNKIITMATDDVNAKTEFVNTIEIDSAYDNFTVSRFEKIKINGIEKDDKTVLYGVDAEGNAGLYGKKLTEKKFPDTFKPAVNRSTNKVRYVVTDEMGHSSPEREFIYDVDNTAPVIAQNTIVVPNVTQTEGLSFRFQATATDTPASTSEKESGISKIQYTFDESKANLREIPGVSSLTETVLFGDSELAYAFESEGEKTIYVRAIDDVGNIGQWTPKTFIYDTGAPILEINSYTQKDRDSVTISDTSVNSLEVSDEFTLGGKVYDENGIGKFEIWQKTDGIDYESGNTLGVKLFETATPNKSWSINKLPRNESNLENANVNSGSYLYTLIATDKAGKTTTKTITAKIDKTSPVVTIDLADGNSNDSTAYGENSLKGSAFTFRGTITDPQENGYASHPAQLYYAFNTTGLAPTLSDYHSITPSTDNWNIPMTLGTGLNTNTADTLYEGKTYLFVYGTDKAGNKSAPISVAFMIDQEEPALTTALYKVTETTTSEETAVNGTFTLNKASGAVKYLLRGSVSDANGISKVIVDGTVVSVQNGNWSKEISQQGKKNHTIVAYDNSGKTPATGKIKESTVSVIFDTTDPDVSVDGLDVTNIERNVWVSGTGDYYINGSAGDGNESKSSGIKELKISLDSGNFETLPLSSIWSYKYKIPSDFEENEDTNQSYHTVTVKAVDNAGNEKSKTYYFRYDKTLPFANLSLDRNSQYAKASDSITFSGYVHDGQTQGRAVDSAVILVKKDGQERSDLTMNVVSDDFGYITEAGNTFGNFSKTISALAFEDGSYEFTLQVKDKAGNSPSATSNLTALLFVDKTNPSISNTELTDWNESHSRAKVNVTFTDSNPDSAYYYINDYSDTSITSFADVSTDDWISMPVSAGSNTYLAYRVHSFNDGNGEIYTKIVDKAGNVSYGETQTYIVDTKAPDVCVLNTVDGTALNGTKLINGENSVTIKVTASDYNDNRVQSTGNVYGDDVNKIASVNLTKLGTTVYSGSQVILGQPGLTGEHNNEKTGEWTITISAAKFSELETGSYPVTVTVTDLAGNKKDFQLFTFDIDNVKPTITSWDVSSSYDAGTKDSVRTYYMNNEQAGLEISGIAWDDREIGTVTLTITGTNASGTALTENQTSTQAAWNFGIAQNIWNNWKNYADVTISVKDKAKNDIETPVNFRIVFDTEGPAGKHLVDESGKDLYFRIGEQANDDINENSISPAWSGTLDTDVGGMYSTGTFGNKETIKIRGNFDDGTGSGVKMIYYKLFTSEPSENDIEAFVENYAAQAISDSNHVGYFSPLSASAAQNAENRVFYNADNSNGNLGNKIIPLGSVTSVAQNSNNATKYYVNTIPTFKTMITGFAAGHNYLVLVAVDNVGNAKADAISNTSSFYTINIDTQAPEIVVNDDIYTQATEDLQLAFTVNDRPDGVDAVRAGIRSVTVNMNGVAESRTAELDENGKWVVTIPSSELPDTDGSYAVSVTAVDNAGEGNSDTRSAGTVIVDTADPAISNIKFEEVVGSTAKTAYSDNSAYYVNNTINGKTFRISGIASDNTGVQNVSLSVTNTAAEPAQALTTQVNNNISNGNWNFEISGIQSWTTGATATVTVTDKAGRTHEESLNIVFDTSLPSISSNVENFTVPTASQSEGSLFKFEGAAGSVSDSGSGLDKVELAFTSGTTAPSAAQVSVTPAADGSWASTVEFANSAFGTVFSNEGTKYLWVRASDKAGNASSWKQAKSFTYDKAAPSISLTATAGNKNPAAGSYRNSGFIFEAEAEDTNGVQSVTVSYGSQTNVPLTINESGKYEKEFTVGNSEGSLADGTYDFTVTVKDNAGKTKSESRTVTIDTTKPVGNFETNSFSPLGTVTGSGSNAKTWYKSTSVRFAVSVTEANPATVEISKDGTVYEAMSLSGTTYNATLSGLEEGLNTITVRMTDLAGNRDSISIPVYSDVSAPSLGVEAATVLSYMGDNGFIVSGSAADSGASLTPMTGAGTADLRVKEEHRAKDEEGHWSEWAVTDASGSSGAVVDVSGNSWTQSVPLGNSTADGEYRYTFILSDNAGNTATSSFTTTVDKTAPELVISNPAAERLGENAVNSTPYQFSGSITEANTVTAIYYQIINVNSNAPSAPAATERLTATSWTGLGWTSLTAEKNWSFYRDIGSASGAITEGKYKIHMYALDGAGNMSSLVSREFHVDMAAPVVTVSAPEYVNAAANEGSARTVTLSGTVTESQLDTFYIKRNGETGNGTPVSVNSTTGSWTYTDTPTADGTYTYTFTATDKVGKTASLTETVTVDTVIPTVTAANITVPNTSQTESSMFKFEGTSGSVSDAGSGLDKVELLFTDTTSTPAATATAQATVTPNSQGVWSSTVEFTGISAFSSEGTKCLWVRAYDKAGNASAWTQKTFMYDTSAPTIDLTSATPSANSYKKAGFKLEAEAEDTNGVQSVTVSYGTQTDVPLTQNESGKWEKSFRVGSETGTAALLDDGAYTFTVKVTDNAGKTKSVTRTLTVDTTNPTGSFAATTPEGTVAGSGSNARTWYKTSSIRFAFAISNTESNIDTVKISKNSTDWESMSLSNGVYVATLTDFEEGSKTITVEMKDLAGNTNTATKTIYVDTTAPTINADTSTVLSFMPSAGFTVSGSVNDTSTASVVSGVKSLKVKEERKAPGANGFSETTASGNGGVEVTVAGGSWSRHVPLGDLEDGEYKYTFILTDEAGNQSTETLPTTKVDTTAPTLEITNPTGKTGTSAISSTSYQFSGSITEDNSVSAIYYKVLSSTAAAPSAPASNVMNAESWTGESWISVSPDKNWSFYRDIKTGTNAIAEGKYMMYMYALDGAGNLSTRVSQEFHVDMAAPVVTVSAPEYVNAAANAGSARTVALSGTVTESQLDTFYIKRNGETGNGTAVSVNSTTGSWTYTNLPTADGTYTYTFTATDKVGKTASLTKTVIVDTAVPTVSNVEDNFTVPTASQTEGNLFKFEGAEGSVSDSDSGSGFDKVELAFTVSTTAPSANQATVTPGSDGTWASTVEFANSAFGTVFNSQGTKYLWVRVYDKAGNSSAWKKAKSFIYDKAVPTISLTASAGNKNPAAGSYRKAGFTLEAEAADTYGVQSVTVSYGSLTDVPFTKNASGKWEKSFRVGSETGTAALLADGDYTFTVKVTDLANKTNTVTRSLSVDTTAPEIDMDNTSVTRTADHTAANSVGWYKSEQIPVTVSVSDDGSGVSAVQIATDTAFTNPTNLRQSDSAWTGTIVCGAQGANTIYIKATDAVGNATTVDTANSLTVMIDTSAPQEPVFLGAGLSDDSMIPASEITSVLVNKQAALTVYGALVDSEESDKSTGIPTASTSAAFKQKGKSGTSATATLNTILSFTKTIQANHAYSVGDVVKNTVENQTKLYVCTIAHTTEENDVFVAANWKDISDYNFWKYTIPTTDMTNGGLNFTVSDNIGNTADYTLFQMVVDNSAPSLTVGQLPDADIATTTINEINGVISISGTASDENGLSTTEPMKLYYTTSSTLPVAPTSGTNDNIGDDAASNWVEIDSIAHANSWSFNNINTASLERSYNSANANETYTTTVYFKVVAKDKAGNTKYSDRITATVDQDTDRPVIKFTNLKLDTEDENVPYMSASKTLPFTTNALYGSVTDDDGISSLAYQYAESDTALTSNWTPLTLTNGTFTLNFPQDGTKKLYFKVVDTGKTVQTVESTSTIVDGSTFTSASANTYSLSTPKLTDSAATPNKYGYRGGTAGSLKTVTYLTVDTTAPWAGTLQFSTNYTDATASTATWSPKSEINNMPFGGRNERQTFRIRIPAWDVNGIKSVSMTLTGSDEADTTNETIEFTNSTVNAGNTTYTAATWWISEEIDVSRPMVSGNKNCLITVTDNANKTSTDEFIISVDNTDPVISASNPSSTQYSSGNVIAYGETDLLHWKNTSTTDTPTEHMYYALSLDDETEPAADYAATASAYASAISSWKDEDGTSSSLVNDAEGNAKTYKPYYTPILGGSFNWYVYFDGSASTANETHDATFRNFLVNSGVTTQALLDTTDQNLKFRTKVKAYLWIKAVDQVGNYTVIKHPILIDPQGDAPKVTIVYPVESGTTLGGAITLRGSANDTKGTNPGVDSVWVQFISSINHGYDSSAEASHTTGTRTAGGLIFVDTVTSTGSESDITYKHSYELNSFTPKIKDVRQWLSNGYQVYKDITTIDDAATTNVTEGPEHVTTIDASIADTTDGSAYFIKANFSGSAWNLKINEHAEFDPGTGKLNPIAYRVFAKDNDGNLSSYEQQLSVYDSDNPVISNVYLRQYSNNTAGTGTVTASRAYEDDIWVKGIWWLCGTVKDTQGLSVLKIGPSSNKENQTLPTTTEDTDVPFQYKLETGTSVGQLKIIIEASDKANEGENPHTTTKECVINYDNTPPELLPNTSANFNISSTVQNSNGFYTFGSQVMENPVGPAGAQVAQSGFDYLAFWFEREITGTNGKHVVYDVMRPKTEVEIDTESGEKEKIILSEVKWADLATFTNAEDARGLKWKSKSVTRSQTELGQLTLTGTDANIHVGGLCMIHGSIYMITSVETTGTGDSATTTIGIDGQPEYNTESETAYFAIANVVNNTVEAGSGAKSTADGMYGYYSSMSNDDGDHMIESVSKQGATWTWEANINSQNIKDGSIVLHYVAFDKAGNFITGQVDGNVANNAPRIASLRVWSDFNENGNEDAGESDTKWVKGKERKINDSYGTRSTAVTDELVVSGNNKDYDDGGSAFMTVKATTRFIPELVGGNGDLYYTYKYGTASTLASETNTPHIGATSIGKGADDGIDEDIDDSGYNVEDQNQAGYINGRTDLYAAGTADSAKHYMEIPGKLATETTGTYSLNALGNSTTESGPTWFEYTIYDSTEGSAEWNTTTLNAANRLSAKFRVALNLKYQDTTRPVVKIRPFYWNSLTDNSVDKLSNPASFADLRGHIELEGDLPTSFTAGGSGVNDRDPKVSGVIKIEGYAFDDIKLKELYVQMSNHTNLKGTGTNGVKVASYDGNWTTTNHADDAGWDFTASDVYCNANGHLVKWTLTVDTAKRGTPAQTDQTVVVYAVDARGSDATNTSVHNGSTQTTLETYRWGDVKNQENSEKLYYEDVYFYKNASKTDTSDNAMVYKVDTWGSVNNEENAYTTYYTDFYGSTHPTNATPDATIVYKNPMSYYYRMDIVPYITKVETGLSKHKTSNWSVYNRTALGHYPVQSVVKNAGTGINLKTTTSESVTVHGFNLNHSTATFASGSNTFTTTATGNLKITNSTDATTKLDKLAFNVANLQTGKLNLTVNNIPLMNNSNNNDAKGTANEAGNSNANYYNLQPNGDTNNIQNDDVEFDVWEFNDRAAVPINGLATGINMEVNQKTGMLNYSFANGGTFYSMGGNINKTVAYDANNSYSSIYWAGDWDTFAGPCVGFHVDELGYTYSVDSGGDTNSSGSADNWILWTSRWGRGNRNENDTINGVSANRLEKIALRTGTGIFDYSLMKYRYLSPEFASTVSGNNTNLYLVYYDALTNEIRFRAGTFSGTTKQSVGGFVDQYTNASPNNVSNENIGYVVNGRNAPDYYRIDNCQVIATSGESVTRKTRTGGVNNTNTNQGTNTTYSPIANRGAGQYVDVAVVKNGTTDVVCVVWYDAEANACKYSYISNPIGNWNNLKGNATAASWSTPKTVFSEGGEYCHIVADKNNHLHIAAYAGNGDVKYAYISTYNAHDAATSTIPTCTVDASGAVGEHLTLDVAVNSKGHSIPYIGYYTSAIKMPKYAFLVDPTVSDTTATFVQAPAGVDLDERFTGAWEATIVPSPSRMTTNREDKVNIGVWKNAGVLTNSTSGTSSRGGDVNGYSSTNWSKTFGNGTSNGVLGYQISTSTGSCLETAQMR